MKSKVLLLCIIMLEYYGCMATFTLRHQAAELAQAQSNVRRVQETLELVLSR